MDDYPKSKEINIFALRNTIFITNIQGHAGGKVFVFNLLGQLLSQHELDGNTEYKISLNTPTGYYLVKIVSGTQTFTGKVFIN